VFGSGHGRRIFDEQADHVGAAMETSERERRVAVGLDMRVNVRANPY
jgi:hypothetical protein